MNRHQQHSLQSFAAISAVTRSMFLASLVGLWGATLGVTTGHAGVVAANPSSEGLVSFGSESGTNLRSHVGTDLGTNPAGDPNSEDLLGNELAASSLGLVNKDGATSSPPTTTQPVLPEVPPLPANSRLSTSSETERPELSSALADPQAPHLLSLAYSADSDLNDLPLFRSMQRQSTQAKHEVLRALARLTTGMGSQTEEGPMPEPALFDVLPEKSAGMASSSPTSLVKLPTALGGESIEWVRSAGLVETICECEWIALPSPNSRLFRPPRQTMG